MVRNISRIDIHAPIGRVWQTLTVPSEVKQWQYGSDIETSWQVGSPIRFKTVWQETLFEQWGTVLEFRPMELIRYSLFAPRQDLEDIPENYFTMSYHITEKGNIVNLEIIQEDSRPGAIQESVQGEENAVLAELRKIAER